MGQRNNYGFCRISLFKIEVNSKNKLFNCKHSRQYKVDGVFIDGTNYEHIGIYDTINEGEKLC